MLLVCKISVLKNPFLHLDSYPETVNSEGDDGEQNPFDPVAEKLQRRAVERKAPALYNRVFSFPSLYHAYGPGRADRKGDNGH